MRWPTAVCCCWAIVALLAGCSAAAPSPAKLGNAGDDCRALTGDQGLTVNLSEEMVAEGRLHAALANLDSLPADLLQVRLRKAKILRLLGDARAQPLYNNLLNTCFHAQALQGLGQLAAARGDYRGARNFLEVAARLAPADYAVRNDLGWVLLQLREISLARFELLTALELNQGYLQTADNLLTLLIYDDQWQEAGRLVRNMHLSPDRFRAAEKRARDMKGEDQGRDGEDGRGAHFWSKEPGRPTREQARAGPFRGPTPELIGARKPKRRSYVGSRAMSEMARHEVLS